MKSTLETVEEEMEIRTFPQQRAWEELREAKVLELTLYVNIGKVKGVILLFKLVVFNSFLFSSALLFL